jgi:hypothetical protein
VLKAIELCGNSGISHPQFRLQRILSANFVHKRSLSSPRPRRIGDASSTRRNLSEVNRAALVRVLRILELGFKNTEGLRASGDGLFCGAHGTSLADPGHLGLFPVVIAVRAFVVRSSSSETISFVSEDPPIAARFTAKGHRYTLLPNSPQVSL